MSHVCRPPAYLSLALSPPITGPPVSTARATVLISHHRVAGKHHVLVGGVRLSTFSGCTHHIGPPPPRSITPRHDPSTTDIRAADPGWPDALPAKFISTGRFHHLRPKPLIDHQHKPAQRDGFQQQVHNLAPEYDLHRERPGVLATGRACTVASRTENSPAGEFT